MKNSIKNLIQSLTLGCLVLTASAQAANINGMKVKSGEFTRVIFNADQALSPKVMLLDNPKRLVLDIKNAPVNDTIQMLNKHNWQSHRYIGKTRVGAFSENTARVVFELKSDVTHAISSDAVAGKPHQLILDIFKVGK